MENTITGTLIEFAQTKEGKSANGSWKFITVIFETGEKYKKKAAIEFWDKDGMFDKIKAKPLGTNLTVHVNIESSEFNDKWITKAKAWKIKE